MRGSEVASEFDFNSNAFEYVLRLYGHWPRLNRRQRTTKKTNSILNALQIKIIPENRLTNLPNAAQCLAYE